MATDGCATRISTLTVILRLKGAGGAKTWRSRAVAVDPHARYELRRASRVGRWGLPVQWPYRPGSRYLEVEELGS